MHELPPGPGLDRARVPGRDDVLVHGDDAVGRLGLVDGRFRRDDLGVAPVDGPVLRLDVDQDGLADCDDPDCNFSPLCQPIEICSNGVDDDGDGLVDCEDPACGGMACRQGGASCWAGSCCSESLETSCDDGKDNDCVGVIDCLDVDCLADSVCGG